MMMNADDDLVEIVQVRVDEASADPMRMRSRKICAH